MVRAVVDEGQSKTAVSHQFRVPTKTVSKWVGRFREHGVEGLDDRSCKPRSLPKPNSARHA